MNKVYLGLGSNLNQPIAQLHTAIDHLVNLPQSKLLKVSKFYKTKPVGFLNQPDFINAAAELTTELDPQSLLAALQAIEKNQGRIRDGQINQPRTIDLDLLVYQQQVIQNPNLVLPHPRLRYRAFVLIPLAEIAPDLQLPNGEKIQDLLANLSNSDIAAIEELVMPASQDKHAVTY